MDFGRTVKLKIQRISFSQTEYVAEFVESFTILDQVVSLQDNCTACENSCIITSVVWEKLITNCVISLYLAWAVKQISAFTRHKGSQSCVPRCLMGHILIRVLGALPKLEMISHDILYLSCDFF